MASLSSVRHWSNNRWVLISTIKKKTFKLLHVCLGLGVWEQRYYEPCHRVPYLCSAMCQDQVLFLLSRVSQVETWVPLIWECPRIIRPSLLRLAHTPGKAFHFIKQSLGNRSPAFKPCQETYLSLQAVGALQEFKGKLGAYKTFQYSPFKNCCKTCLRIKSLKLRMQSTQTQGR